MNILSFSYKLFSRVVNLLSERKKEALRAEKILEGLEVKLGGRLNEGARMKVINSYSAYQLIIIDAFTGLYGRSTTEAEKERLIYYFICSSTFDDFLDNNELSEEQLEIISFKSDLFKPTRIEEKMFLYCHSCLKAYVHDRDAYYTAFRNVYNAQLNSVKQACNEKLSYEELLNITLEKGGYSVELCHFYLNNQASEAERNCWYLTGGIIQLTNDLFDIWKDLQANIQTVPNSIRDAYSFRQFLSAKVDELIQCINELTLPDEQKETFLFHIMSVCSFSNIAVSQLCEIQQQQPELPDLRSLPRKALIIDMEKPANIWHCMRFTYQKVRSCQESSVSLKPIPA